MTRLDTINQWYDRWKKLMLGFDDGSDVSFEAFEEWVDFELDQVEVEHGV